jgi:hypothetical protein
MLTCLVLRSRAFQVSQIQGFGAISETGDKDNYSQAGRKRLAPLISDWSMPERRPPIEAKAAESE